MSKFLDDFAELRRKNGGRVFRVEIKFTEVTTLKETFLYTTVQNTDNLFY